MLKFGPQLMRGARIPSLVVQLQGSLENQSIHLQIQASCSKMNSKRSSISVYEVQDCPAQRRPGIKVSHSSTGPQIALGEIPGFCSCNWAISRQSNIIPVGADPSLAAQQSARQTPEDRFQEKRYTDRKRWPDERLPYLIPSSDTQALTCLAFTTVSARAPMLHHTRGSCISMDVTDIHGEDSSWWARHARLVDILNILNYYSTSLKIQII